ncbi:calcium-binding protein [Ramlibacter sp.]|uniref:beta strand repeat-containing protein n=1 Tax=Ramlibacter sp. TaxID=1917967 RepID=UPI002C3A6927|nr:calcium-binding protein [Ramlibacter sp.]HWI84503.1 calcium-binding protein [Ramlibacter sp.]
MAITTAERNQIIELTVLMFNAAPGANYLSQIVTLYEANAGTQAQKLQALANQLATTSVYRSLHPNFETAEEFAADFLTPLGLQNDATAKDFIVAKFNAGVSKGQIAYEAYAALNAVPSTGAAQYVAANAILNNKTTVAEYYSVTKEAAATDLATLQSVLTGVTASADSVTAAKAAIDNQSVGGVGQTFALTINQDTFGGTSGDDQYIAGVTTAADGVTQVQTLQAIDQINGGDGVDTLNATLITGGLVAPALTNVENVIVRSTNAGSGINFAGATGVQKITVSNSTATAAFTNVGAAATLGIANQSQNVSFDNSTATTLGLSFDTVGSLSVPTEVAIDIGATAASKATTLNITTVNSNVEVTDTAGTNVATAASIAATGSNEVKLTDGLNLAALTVTGSGSVDVSEVQLVKVGTLTVADGGVTFDNGDSTATTFTATTGAGADTLKVDGANVKSISTGAGKDSVTTQTAALAATATIDLGAGDDTLTLHAAPTAGATLTGGDGKDTLALAVADYNTVSAFTAANLAKITGFEILSATDAAVADTASIDLSKIAGLTGFQSKGVAAAGTATVTNVGANADVILKGALGTNTGTLVVTLKDATGTSDTLNLTLNANYAENNDATATVAAVTETVQAAGVEIINVTSTGTPSTKFLGAAGTKADGVNNTLALTDTALTTLNVSGNQAFTFNTADAQTKLAVINASANTAGAVISAASTTTATNAALTITGSATAGNTLTGSANADTIVGGAKSDTITGGAGADALTGGAGNDVFVIAAATDSTLAKMDTIADFSANTVGLGTNGAANELGAAGATLRTGDVIDLSAATPTNLEFSVQANATDVQVFIQNSATDGALAAVNAALDSSTGRLYIDFDNNGTIDTVIALTGVTTLTTAAFVI